MLKRLAAAGAVTAAVGGVLLTASPALAGGDCHGGFGCHSKHERFHNHHHFDFDYYKHDHKHNHIDNHNNNINKPVVVFDHEEEGIDPGLLGL